MERMDVPVILADGTLVEVVMIKRKWTTPARAFDAGTRVYVDEIGETIIENLVNRGARPVKAYKAIVLETLQHIDINDKRIAWSQRAGCSCGCSPGFVLRAGDNSGVTCHRIDGTPVDIWVRIQRGTELIEPTVPVTK